jgi:hypothetical protein
VIIAVDFDGTIVDHCFPAIGDPVPGAARWLKRFQEFGAKLILWTMRADGREGGFNPLTEAVEYCRSAGIEFWAVNANPEQAEWTASPKAYAHIYIDDAAFGCPLKENPRADGRPFADWDKIGPAVEDILKRMK